MLTSGMFAVCQDITEEQFPTRCPEIFSRIKKIDAEISGGTAALIALIVNNRLYVANVGMLNFSKSAPLKCKMVIRHVSGSSLVTQHNAE